LSRTSSPIDGLAGYEYGQLTNSSKLRRTLSLTRGCAGFDPVITTIILTHTRCKHNRGTVVLHRDHNKVRSRHCQQIPKSEPESIPGEEDVFRVRGPAWITYNAGRVNCNSPRSKVIGRQLLIHSAERNEFAIGRPIGVAIPRWTAVKNEAAGGIPGCVVDLLWRDVQRNKQRRALMLSWGSWNPEDHPELAEGGADYVVTVTTVWLLTSSTAYRSSPSPAERTGTLSSLEGREYLASL
jgi:hypothetical protein